MSKKMNTSHTTLECGANPPYRVVYIDPSVCLTKVDQWYVMGTVDGNPRNPGGPVAICEHEPSAHVIAGLLNASGGTWTRDHVVSDSDPCWCDPDVISVGRR